MMEVFAQEIKTATNTAYSHLDRCVQCMAHVVNLATQALIKAYSKSKHFDPENPDDHVPDTEAFIRDEVGLIRAIAVKVSMHVSLYAYILSTYLD
jgi:hypothetical protein